MRHLAVVLISLAPACALAQSDAGDMPPPPEPRLEAYQALKGIDAATWKALELTTQAGIEAKHARLPKRMEITSISHVTVGGRLLRPAQTVGTIHTSTGRLSPLRDGFILVESDFTIESEGFQSSGKSTELRWLGLHTLYAHVSVKTRLATFGRPESSEVSITKLDKWSSDLKLEEMKPGYRWRSEFSRVTERQSGPGRTANFKMSCEVAEGGAAATLAPELSGNFLKVRCENTASGRQIPAEWAYLEEYGYFLALESSTERVSITNRFRVLEPATPP